MTTLKRSLAWIAMGIVIALSCVFLTAFLRTCAKTRRASELLSIVNRFSVGKTRESEAMREVRPFLSGLASEATGKAGGEYEYFVFDNIELNKLGLSNYRRFTVVLNFQDGVLSEKHATLWVEHDCSVSVTERLHPVLSDTEIRAFDYHNHFSTIPAGFDKPVATASIIDDETYAESLRAADWKFNLAYLTRFGRCEDARVILPAIAR